MSRRLLVSLLLPALLLATPARADDAALATRLDAVLQRLAPAEAHVGVVVKALGVDAPLYERDSQKLFTPASLQKLATASAVLSILGTQRRFATRLLTQGLLEGGVLHGHLFLRGEGDPTLEPADLEALASHLRAQGVKRIAGDLVADASYFQPEGRGAAGWVWDDLAEGYGAPVSALSLHRNTLDLGFDAGPRAGAPVAVSIAPGTSYVQLQSRARTEAAGSPGVAFTLAPALNGVWQEQLAVRGGLAVGSAQASEHLSVSEPVRFTAVYMKEALNRAGIAIDGQVRLGVTPTDARAIAVHASPYLAEIAREMLKESDNLLAESMLLQLGAQQGGAPGTWTKGLAALDTFVQRAGWRANTYRISDGSGLSRYDAVTPAQLAGLLSYMPSQPVGYPALLVALPVAGMDGTLAKRLDTPFTRGKLRAKTGTMSGVSGLAGYLETADGRSLVVVVMVNGFVGPAGPSRAVQDAIIGAIAEPGT